MDKVTKIISFLLFVLGVKSILAQRIDNVDFTVKDNILTVTYDLVNCAPKYVYDVALVIIDDKGKQTRPVSTSGNIKKQEQGINKKIEWQVLSDVPELKGNIQVMVEITKSYSTKVDGGPESAFLSMLLPGLGDRLVNKQNKKWYYISALYLASAYYTLSLKSQSDNYYSQYHKATTQDEMDQTYSHATDSYHAFQFLFGVTAIIWAADVIYVAVKGSQNKQAQLGNMAYHPPKLDVYFTGSQKGIQIGLKKKF